MIKHIVFWKLRDFAAGKTKEENARELKKTLEALNGKIPGLLRLEVGIDFSCTDQSADVALYSEFNTRKDLEVYQEHPAHKAVMPLVTELRRERIVVDYDTEA